jgi:hypothetical protein
MAKKAFSGTGLGKVEEKPIHKRTLLDEINKDNFIVSSVIEPMNDNEPTSLKRHTFLINEDMLEKMKDYVYTVKIGGNLMFTQQDCLEEAIFQYLEGKTIIPRPEEYRDKFKKK